MVTACNRLGIGKHYAVNILILILISFCDDTRDFCAACASGVVEGGGVIWMGQFLVEAFVPGRKLHGSPWAFRH